MAKRPEPDQVMGYFFKSLLQYHFPVCWSLFSDKSKKTFLEWTLKELYKRHNKAAAEVKLGLPEIKYMFESNDQSLIQIFWRRFVAKCNANDFCRYASFSTESTEGKQANVLATIRYPDGRSIPLRLIMQNEMGGWKFGYLESGFKIE